MTFDWQTNQRAAGFNLHEATDHNESIASNVASIQTGERGLASALGRCSGPNYNTPMSFVTHLESAIDGTRLPADVAQTMHNDRPLWVRYDLDAVGKAVRPDDLAARAPTLWRYRELLPIQGEDSIVTLGEGVTPILQATRLGAELGLEDLWTRD